MDDARRGRVRAHLEARRDALRAGGDLAIEPGRIDPASAGVDDDAQPLLEMSQAIASGRNRARTAELRAVVQALDRLEKDPGAFGACLECGEAIPDRRLELMPWVELCADCQEAGEEDRPYGRKHVGDYR